MENNFFILIIIINDIAKNNANKQEKIRLIFTNERGYLKCMPFEVK